MTVFDARAFCASLERHATSKARIECAQIAMDVREQLWAAGDYEGAKVAMRIAGVILDKEAIK